MSETTYREMTPADLWIAGDALPGMLDGWCGPLEVWSGATWHPAVMDPFGIRPVWQPTFNVPAHRLDCRRLEVQARLADVLYPLGVNLGPALDGRRKGLLTGDEAAAVCWLSAARRVVPEVFGLAVTRMGGPGMYPDAGRVMREGIIGGRTRADDYGRGTFSRADRRRRRTMEESRALLDEALLEQGHILREPGALLLPLPGGVSGRLALGGE